MPYAAKAGLELLILLVTPAHTHTSAGDIAMHHHGDLTHARCCSSFLNYDHIC